MTIWQATEAEIIARIKEDSEFIHTDGVDHWLEVNDYLIKGKIQPEHSIFVQKHLPKKKRQMATSKDTDILSLDDLLLMENWDGIEDGVYINVTKKYKTKKRVYTVLFNYNHMHGVVLPETLFVPPDTQPSITFLQKSATFEDVFNSLVRKYREILYYDDRILHEVLALAAMSTYFRESFRTYPYMDFQGAEVNSGKTTSMECLVFASFYGFTTMDPTGPVIFRAIDNCHASIGIDEIDNLIYDPETASSILGILNASYKKGTMAYRTNKETYQPEAYDPFGMKSFSRIKPIPDALISRSITFLCVRAPKKMKQLKGPEDFTEERDGLYWLRMNSADVVTEAQKLCWDLIDMKNRDREKWISILTMAYCVNIDLFDKIHAWAQNHSLLMVEAQVDDVKRTLVEVLLGKSGNVTLIEIHDEFMLALDRYQLIKVDRANNPINWQPRTTLRVLGELGIFKSSYQAREPQTGRTQVWVNRERVEALAKGTYALMQTNNEKEGELMKYLENASLSSLSSPSSQNEGDTEHDI